MYRGNSGGGSNPSGVTSVGNGFAVNNGVLNSSYPAPRSVTGTTDTITVADAGGEIIYNNTTAIAVGIASAASAGFTQGFAVYVWNKGFGVVTITPTTSTINGAATLVIAQGAGGLIYSDGTNYLLDFTASTSLEYFNPPGDLTSTRLGGAFSSVYTGTSNNNIGIGKGVFASFISGSNNVVIGALSGGALTTASQCTVVGYNALSSNQTTVCTALGYQTLRIATGNGNTAVGVNAGGSITTGQDNICIGSGAGNGNATSGNSNVLIGNGADVVTAGDSQQFNIGNVLRGKVVKPAVASGFGTSPTTTGSCGTAAFIVTVGTGGTATSGVLNIGFNAPNGWALDVTNSTSSATLVAVAVPTGTGQVTISSYSRTTGLLTAFNASDVLVCKALAY